MSKAPIEQIEKLVNENTLAIVINALQQLCFHRADELRRELNGKERAKRFYNVGIALDEAVQQTE